uniref:SEFIR domain-containing protein n=1 Tax=Candidatus Kentrum sp. SD TaxID=2126332 RepID=A0A450Y4B4_9GAMM|nr:MAG: SEFIR domain-containing protein [Candidatus Kentron sp. SD]VFK38614.1 MAG: SEFIR domain-containing protein [Candidatus Kentron sp. SD]
MLVLLLAPVAGFAPENSDSGGHSGAKSPKEHRVALVIGNSEYKHLGELKNPKNDAEAVAKRLHELDFTLIDKNGEPISSNIFADISKSIGMTGKAVHNLTEEALLDALQGFEKHAGEGGQKKEIVLVYYAGHGMQTGSESYLLPVDIRATDSDRLRRNGFSIGREILQRLDGKAELVVTIFDACRQIPDSDDTSRGVSISDSDFKLKTKGKYLLAYSTTEGKLARDGMGENSPYTTVLLEHLDKNIKDQNTNESFVTLLSNVNSDFYERHKPQRPVLRNEAVPANKFFLKPGKDTSKTSEGNAMVPPGEPLLRLLLIAGIAIAVVLLLALLAFFFIKTRSPEPNSSPRYPYEDKAVVSPVASPVADEGDAIGNTATSSRSGNPVVFISYSHDSKKHKNRVKGLAQSLSRDGCECRLDLYKDTDEDWPSWMTRQLREADFILCVVTPTYKKRFNDEELPGVGKGVGWEAGLIRRLLYSKKLRNNRIFPVLFEDSLAEHIPIELDGYEEFVLQDPSGYEDLLRKLTNQPRHLPPKPGSVPVLPPEETPFSFQPPDHLHVEPMKELVAITIEEHEPQITVVTNFIKSDRPWSLFFVRGVFRENSPEAFARHIMIRQRANCPLRILEQEFCNELRPTPVQTTDPDEYRNAFFSSIATSMGDESDPTSFLKEASHNREDLVRWFESNWPINVIYTQLSIQGKEDASTKFRDYSTAVQNLFQEFQSLPKTLTEKKRVLIVFGCVYDAREELEEVESGKLGLTKEMQDNLHVLELGDIRLSNIGAWWNCLPSGIQDRYHSAQQITDQLAERISGSVPYLHFRPYLLNALTQNSRQ